MFKQTGRLKPFQTACGLVGFTTQPTRRVNFYALHHSNRPSERFSDGLLLGFEVQCDNG